MARTEYSCLCALHSYTKSYVFVYHADICGNPKDDTTSNEKLTSMLYLRLINFPLYLTAINFKFKFDLIAKLVIY